MPSGTKAGVSLEAAESGSTDRNEDLEQRVATMKREVDALQVQAMEKAKRWHTLGPVVVSLIVSVLALGFSFWTNQKSENRLEQQERHEARVELRGIIQRLQILPKENFELYRTHASDSGAQIQLGTLINTENIMLGRQAADLIEELDGDVSAIEYYATAYALQLSEQSAESMKLAEQGLKVADDPISEIWLLRQAALMHFAVGDPDGGRRRFQEATAVFEKDEEATRHFIARTNTSTETYWAQAELGQRECSEAWQHVGAAKGHAAALRPEDPVALQRNQIETSIKTYCDSL